MVEVGHGKHQRDLWRSPAEQQRYDPHPGLEGGTSLQTLCRVPYRGQSIHAFLTPIAAENLGNFARRSDSSSHRTPQTVGSLSRENVEGNERSSGVAIVQARLPLLAAIKTKSVLFT